MASIEKLHGANMDIDLASPSGSIACSRGFKPREWRTGGTKPPGWQQDACPWNRAEGTQAHRCAVKNVSICAYFCGVEYLDTLLCCYPGENPYKSQG